MKIKLISNKPYPEFEFYEENKLAIYIKIDIKTGAFRIICQGNRRMFFIENKVTKTGHESVLLNEYSQQLGLLTEINLKKNAGEIELGGAGYSYKLDDDFLRGINLFEPDNDQPLLSCSLETGQLSFFYKSHTCYLLFALVWYIFLTKKQEVLFGLPEHNNFGLHSNRVY